MSDPDRFVARLRRRLLVGEFLHVAAGWTAGFLLLFGLAVLAVKLFAPRFSSEVYWSVLAVLPLLGVSAWRAWRRVPFDRDVIALLDKRLEAGGLLMTLSERPDPRWRQRLPSAERWAAVLPRVRPVRFAKAVVVPALFAAGAGFMPAREEPPPAPQVTAGTDAAKELADTFELLDQADAVDGETKESLKEELDRLAEEAEDKPLTHEKWETVDALRERLRTGLDATNLTVSHGRSAAAALASARAGGEPLSAERMEQLNEDLAKALEMLRKNGAFDRAATQAASALSPELQRLLKSGEFQLPADPAERKEALSQLAQLLDSEQKRLAEARGKCQACLGTQGSLSDLLAQSQSQVPGQGGISSGGDSAELTYGRESDEQAAKFKEAVLPPGFLDRPNDVSVGVTASAPEVDPAGRESRNAARPAGSATGQTTWDRPLRPRHREVVREYFGDRKVPVE
jgi:hypothetical protein